MIGVFFVCMVYVFFWHMTLCRHRGSCLLYSICIYVVLLSGMLAVKKQNKSMHACTCIGIGIYMRECLYVCTVVRVACTPIHIPHNFEPHVRLFVTGLHTHTHKDRHTYTRETHALTRPLGSRRGLGSVSAAARHSGVQVLGTSSVVENVRLRVERAEMPEFRYSD